MNRSRDQKNDRQDRDYVGPFPGTVVSLLTHNSPVSVLAGFLQTGERRLGLENQFRVSPKVRIVPFFHVVGVHVGIENIRHRNRIPDEVLSQPLPRSVITGNRVFNCSLTDSLPIVERT